MQFFLSLLLATTSSPSAPAESGEPILLYAIIVVAFALLAGAGLAVLFVYLSGRLITRTVSSGVEAGSRVVTSSVETAGELAKGMARSVGEGAGAIGRAMKRFARERSSTSIYAAICEARPSFEVITCKMTSVVYHKLERKGWQGKRALVEIMPIEISYGFDLSHFSEKDIQVTDEGQTVEILLPPLRVISLEKGTPEPLFNNVGKLDVDSLRECQVALDQRMREFARSPKTLSIAEELSQTSFRQILSMIFFLVEEEARPKELKLKVRPRDSYRLNLPAPLQLETHHLPEDLRENDEEEL